MDQNESQDAKPSNGNVWHEPTTPGAWREPSEGREEKTGGWRVPAMPPQTGTQPEAEGDWHQPNPDDTSYTEESTLEVRPEDAILDKLPPEAEEVSPEEMTSSPPEPPPEDLRPEDISVEPMPEDADEPPEDEEPEEDDEALRAPEDYIYMIEEGHAGELSPEDQERTSWGEYVALASLTEEESEVEESPNVIKGEDAPISPSMVSEEDEGDEDIDESRLSPVEQMMLGRSAGQKAQTLHGEVVDDVEETGTSQEHDPAAYARQQLEKLQGGGQDQEEDAESDPASYARQQLEKLQGGQVEEETGQGEATRTTQTDEQAEDDPASYARQQLEKLQGGAQGGQGAAQQQQQQQQVQPQAKPAPEELSPREQDLLRQYRQTEQQVQQLRQQRNNGQISQQEYVNQLRDLMILDDDHVWWMLGVDSNQWYKSQDNQWVAATPEVFKKAERIQQQGGQNGGQYGSIPYIQEDGQGQAQQTQQGEESSGGVHPQGHGFGEDMPLPRDVPQQDPENTVASNAAFNMQTQQGGAGEATLPNQGAGGQATVPSQGGAQQAGGPTQMASAVDYGAMGGEAAQAPDYEYEEEELEGEEFQAARERARRSTTSVLALVAAVVVGIVFLAGAGLIGISLLWYQNLSDDWQQPIAAVADGDAASSYQTVEIRDRDGNRIAMLARDGNVRQPVDLQNVSPYMVHAVLSLQDPSFYERSSWNLFSTVGAFTENLLSGGVNADTSAITRQVARSLVLSDASFTSESERALSETVVINELTDQFTAPEILELYLNNVAVFGNQTFGVEAAAQFYLDKSAAELNMPEAALLASIIEDPARFEPIGNFDLALERARATMDRMEDVGCISFQAPAPGGTQEQCVYQDNPDAPASSVDSSRTANNVARIIRNIRRTPRDESTRYPTFIKLVRNQLEATYRDEMYRSGYVVTTTLDASLQEEAEQILQNRINELRTSGVNTGALMVTDPRNGAILALIGSTNVDGQQLDDQDRTYQQPGEIISPVVYAMGLSGFDTNGNGVQQGEYVTPASILWDVPTSFQNGSQIQNFDNRYGGPVPLRNALANSIEVPTYKVFNEFGGMDHFRQTADNLGIRFRSDADFSEQTPLGTTEVRLYDMMKVYGAIANDGRLSQPFTIQRIQDANGQEIPIAPELRSEPTQAIDEDVAFLLQSILSDDQARQRRYPANSQLTISGLGLQDQVGALAGTSPGARDLWTVGFTTNRATGIWLGTSDDSPTLNNLTGFTATAPVWNSVMRTAIQGTEVGRFTPTGDVLQGQVCADTGTAPPGSTCANIVNEVFISNRRPPSPDEGLTTTLRVDSWTGLIANNNCPDNIIEQQFANIDDPTAINWLNNTQAGQQYARRVGLPLPAQQAPTQSCDINTPIPVGRITSPAGGQTVQGSVPVNGQVSAQNFARYELQVAPAGTENFQTLTTSSSQRPDANSTLGTWDTTNVTNGDYTLRLAVFANNANNGFMYRSVDVTVNNPEPTATPVPTEIPTNTPVPASPAVPTDPLPFDEPTQSVPTGPTPTVDPLGG